jgi:ubiquinone/menaquinone biosynthesis C-methylase UbiE
MSEWDSFWSTRTTREKVLNRLGIIFNRAFARHIASYMSKSGLTGPILEIGAGRGTCTRTLLGMGYECVGVDSSQVAVELCRSQNLNVTLVDARCLPFAPKTFQVAFTQGLLEHLALNEQIVILSEMQRVARVVINSVPMKCGVMDIGERALNLFGKRWPYPNEKKYKRLEFIELLATCFRTVKVEQFLWVDWISYCQ